MQPHKPTEPLAERTHALAACLAIYATFGCAPPLLPGDGDDSQPVPDLPTADLPPEQTEFEGKLSCIVAPCGLKECTTGEWFEISLSWQDGDLWTTGSCVGVYNRVSGHLDRSFDPPRLFLDEWLEARWLEPDDCSFEYLEPFYDTCYLEEDETGGCEPTLGCSNASKCQPERFDATEFAGWKHHECLSNLGDAVVGDPCEYPEGGDLDTCADTLRCWNPAGDLNAPGTCMQYCDVNGEEGDPCEGTCVPCSSRPDRGLCLPDCSGDDCNVDAFC
jgi:hypothetical protein